MNNLPLTLPLTKDTGRTIYIQLSHLFIPATCGWLSTNIQFQNIQQKKNFQLYMGGERASLRQKEFLLKGRTRTIMSLISTA